MIHDGSRPVIPRLVGRCQSCGTKDVVVFHVESDDRRVCRACLACEIADSADVPMYEGGTWSEWCEVHQRHEAPGTVGCPLCGATAWGSGS